MATHDYIIANASGAAFRTDLNNALAAIVSNNSNSSEPATKYAYQWWADTSAAVMKLRNSANDGWIELFQLDGTLTVEDGSASTPGLAFRDDLNTGIFSSDPDTFHVATGGVERMKLGTTTIFNDGGNDVDFRIEGDNEASLFYVDAGNDNIGIGTSAPDNVTNYTSLIINHATSGGLIGLSKNGTRKGTLYLDASSADFFVQSESGEGLAFATNGSNRRISIESDGDIGMATTSPNASGFGGPVVSIGKSANPYSVLEMQGNQTSDGAFAVIAAYNSGGSARTAQLVFSRNNANDEGVAVIECARGGTLGEVARFTNTSDEKRIIVGGTDETNTSGESSWMGIKLKGARPYLVFHEDDRSGDAQHGSVAHTTGALFITKMGGRIGFSISDSGAPSEKMNFQGNNVGLRIGAGGTTSTFDEMRLHSGAGREGIIQRLDGSNVFTTSNQHIFRINRCTTDGTIVQFIQDGTVEGEISVSGGTVSYGGGHLSRWSQLKGISSTDKSARPTIYQGTVMSNLDDLCSWTHADVLYEEDVLYTSADTIPEGKEIGDIKHAKGDVLRAGYTEDNQQLNMTKVSDVEGDKDVAGVFWAWDDDDDEIVNDFYVAMTGDMVIRVAASTTVARGDLLISAGDGTAKPQADDIVRSSTIAKIISTNHTATYADGSKAYPCVLMAC